MLSLDSPRWGELAQAYGTAEDVPRLLAALGALPDERDRAQLWFALWRLLCHEERVYSASYAAAPHVMAMLLADDRLSLHERAQALQLVASIEGHRHHAGAPAVPGDLVAGYAAAVEQMPAVVCASAGESWDAEVARVMACALLVAKRQPRLGMALLAWDAEA